MRSFGSRDYVEAIVARLGYYFSSASHEYPSAKVQMIGPDFAAPYEVRDEHGMPIINVAIDSTDKEPTFHFSMSSCCRLYCLTSSSRTFFNPSEFVWSAGVTSFTVFSTKTPLTIRKHLRSGGRGASVSSTSLFEQRMSGVALNKAFTSEASAGF